MRKSLCVAFLAIVWTGEAEAANLAVITSPPTILNLLTFLLALAAVTVCLRVLAALKGGYLSKSWQLLVAGFGLLGLSQLSSLLQAFEIISLPVWVAPFLMGLWVGTFFYAVFEAKRVLGQ